MNNSDDFKLKPIGKIKPEQYILFIYSFFAILTIFLITNVIFFITKKDYLTFNTYPENAAVYLDDSLIGYTPLSYKIDNKPNIITIKKYGFESEKIDFKSINRKTLSFSLKGYNGSDFLKDSYNNASNWSLIKSEDIDIRYPIPLLFSPTVTNYFYMNDFNKVVLENYLTSSLKQVTNDYILSDYIRALTIYKSNNKLLSVSSIINSASFLDKLQNKYKDAPLLIGNKILKDSDNFVNSKVLQRLSNNHLLLLNKYIIKFDDPDKDIIIDDFIFKNIPKSSIIPENVNFLHIIDNYSFYISNKLLSKESYLKFIKDEPFWAKDNKEELINLNLVDKNYLDFYNDELYITNVSYYCAAAWCDWANKNYKIPEGYKISLPSENMWHSVTQFNILENIDSWVWTNQGFYMYDHFLATTKGEYIPEFTSDIIPRVVVGNNKYNKKEESGIGVQDASWCTPYISIRPVLIKIKEN